MDIVSYIGQEVRSIMALVAEIDPDFPDEELVEVLIGAVTVWGNIEADLLYSALEAAFEGAEETTKPARERLNALYVLQNSLHETEGSDVPYSVLTRQYVDGVKYHLGADIQFVVPLAVQLPENISHELAASMSAMKLDLA